MQWMKKRVPALVCALLMAVLVIACNGRGAKRWAHIEESRLTFFDGLERTGESYGVMNEGPALTLQAGRYTLSWDVETDGAGAIELTTTNGAAITPRRIELTPETRTGSVQIHAIDQVYNLQLLVSYESGSYLRVNGIDLIADANTDRLFLALFVLAGIAALNLLSAGGFLTPRRRGELVILALTVLIASIPVLKENLNGGHDSSFHIDRLLNMLNALRSGQFPARLGAYMQNGYGAVTSVFYPELFLYLPAGMMLANATLNFSMHVFFIAITATTALTMRVCAGRLFRSADAGMISAILYTLSAYRLTDMYTRFGIGETLAMAFLPLFVLGLYELVWGDRRRWKLLAFSCMAIYQSHMITTALCALAVIAVCAVCAVKIVREGRVVPLCLAGLCALGLCLYALLPLADYISSGVGVGMMVRRTSEHLLSPAQLLLSMDSVSGTPADGTLKGFSLVIGLPLLVGAAAALIAAVTREKRTGMDRAALILVAAGAAFALATTTLCPWARLESLTGGLVSFIQFPWRLLSVTTLCLALAGGYGLSQVLSSRGSAAQLAVLTLCAALALPLLSAETRKENYIEAGHVPDWTYLYEDYTLGGTFLRGTLDQTVHTQGDVTVTDYDKAGTSITAGVEAEQGGTVSFPLFAFDGYEAELSGERVEIARGENNRITVDVPAGTRGTLTIRFAGKPIWRVGEAVSLLTALAMAAHALHERKGRRSAR